MKASTQRVLSVIVVVTADFISLMDLKDTWYNEKRCKFHGLVWDDDIHRWLQMDKIGHVAHAAYASDLFSKIYRWSGYSASKSIWMGSLSGWLWLLQIEITFWFTANIYDLMPKTLQNRCPSGLKPFGTALGQTSKGVAVNSLGGVREVMFSIDIDLSKTGFYTGNFLIFERPIWNNAMI